MKRHQLLEGIVKRHPDGFGFLVPDDTTHPDLYIPKHSMKGIMTNDKVEVEVFPEPGGQRFRGEITKVIQRSSNKIVGAFQIDDSEFGVVLDEGKAWGENLKIPLAFSKNAKTNDLVAVEIKSYPGSADGFWGKVSEVIGNAEDPMTDIKRVLITQHIPHEFHPKTLQEAEEFPNEVTEKDFKGRKDLRHLNFITIDGATAKDFDDAIYVEQQDDGFLLYVAIADVSHYVRLGTQLDLDAYERGTSVYFPNYVVPMLPEALSNELCSLKPHVPRLSLVAEMKLDFSGDLMFSEFYEAVIESKARVTYGEAQEIIDDSYDGNQLLHVKEDILRASNLAKILMAYRFKNGSLDLEIPETQVILDGAGIPIDIIKSERLFAHRLIEEMMLAANVAVAKFLTSKEIPALYRIHEEPKQEAIATLEKYLHNFGSKHKLTQKASHGHLQKRLTRALQEFEGKPEAQVLNILTLRSMSQAKYSSENVGHFGLGFEFYSHFTSPIRRYPDLIVHRLIKSQVMPYSGYAAEEQEDLQTAANMLSACEQRAVKSERQFVAIKKARFMQKHIGEDFDGVISSVTKFGVFVLLREFEVDGLVRMTSLSKEKLEFDEERLVLYSRRSGLTFGLGDILKITVVNADPVLGQIDFEIAGQLQQKAGTLQNKTPSSRKNHDDDKTSSRSYKNENTFAKHGDTKMNNKRGEYKAEVKKKSKFDSESKSKTEVKSKKESRSKYKSGNKNESKFIPKSDFKSSSKSKEKSGAKTELRSKSRNRSMDPDFEIKPTPTANEKNNFDPAAHFEKVLNQWKDRNPHLIKANNHQNVKHSGRKSSPENERQDKRTIDDDARIKFPESNNNKNFKADRSRRSEKKFNKKSNKKSKHRG